MSKYQAKLTEDEIKAALKYVAYQVADGIFTEELFERFSYLSKRLLKIQKGESDIEIERTIETAATEQPKTTW